jgi:signal peptidase II
MLLLPQANRASVFDLGLAASSSGAVALTNLMKMPKFRRGIVFFAALILDWITKYWARLCVLPHSAGQKAAFPSLRLYNNHGISFSLLRDNPGAGLLVSLLGITAFLLWLRLQGRSIRSMPGVVLLGAGMAGNLADRLLYGHIVDWIYVGIYINLADLWLCAGGVLVIVQCLKANK